MSRRSFKKTKPQRKKKEETPKRMAIFYGAASLFFFPFLLSIGAAIAVFQALWSDSGHQV